MKVFSIGYSGKSFEKFVKSLKQNKVELLIDVRRFPRSKYPDFVKNALRKKLAREGIEYLHLPELGGFRGGFERYMKSLEFKRGVKKLMGLIQRKTCCIMCRESKSVYCHRRYILAHLRSLKVKTVDLK